MTFAQVILVFPIAVLANWQIIETWRHGSIFQGVREWLETKHGFFADLLLCNFCLSHWTGLAITIALFCSMQGLDHTYWQVAVIYALGVTRLPQVFNDLGYSFWRMHSNKGSSEDVKAAEAAMLARLQGKPDDTLTKLEKELDADVKS